MSKAYDKCQCGKRKQERSYICKDCYTKRDFKWTINIEKAILMFIALSLSLKEIAFMTKTHPKTIEYHFQRAQKRFQVFSKANITRWAVKHKLVKI